MTASATEVELRRALSAFRLEVGQPVGDDVERIVLGRIADLERELAEARTDLAEYERTFMQLQDEIDTCTERAVADSARLREALQKYGEHRAGCALGELPAGENICDCGFDAAIDAGEQVPK